MQKPSGLSQTWINRLGPFVCGVAAATLTMSWAKLTLVPGRWWIYARSWDANDPNAEWYWNVPVDSDNDWPSA